ncbi:MAG: sulfite exporter TauE/SafE family protein [Thermodesulfobacteriota bacterium]
MSDIFLVFLMGLFGSLHCVAMCGGLVSACSMRFGGGFWFSLKYNAGRVFTYALLGLVMGLLGKALISAGAFGRFQSLMPVIAGVFMVFVGLDLIGALPQSLKRLFAGLVPSPLSGVFRRAGTVDGRVAPVLLGMLNGLIPCGLLYAVGVKAASTADPATGAMMMAALGAGNFLPLLFTGSLSGLLRKKALAFTVASSIIIILLGVKSIILGAGPLHTHTQLAAAMHVFNAR